MVNSNEATIEASFFTSGQHRLVNRSVNCACFAVILGLEGAFTLVYTKRRASSSDDRYGVYTLNVVVVNNSCPDPTLIQETITVAP